jgi:hypothetical protein
MVLGFILTFLCIMISPNPTILQHSARRIRCGPAAGGNLEDFGGLDTGNA